MAFLNHFGGKRDARRPARWEIADESGAFDPEGHFDPLGSYTGVPDDGGDPVQDADDL